MNKTEMTQFEGSLSFEDVVDALISSHVNTYGAETLPELYEHLVKCSRCPFEEKCDKLAAALEENGYSPYCNELLSIMLGEKKISDFI
jgi:hypothetical protein